MKCRLCEKIFNVNSSFTTLFYFPEICPECNKKYTPYLKTEVYPIDYGEITYIYLYDMPLNLVQRNYLDKHFVLFFKYLEENYHLFDICLVIDSSIKSYLAEYGSLIKSFGNILFFSLTYIDLISFKYFD
ncbi:MAG: hypothetical protein WC152_05700 [Candidatus Izemoplasmatales bacterium]